MIVSFFWRFVTKTFATRNTVWELNQLSVLGLLRPKETTALPGAVPERKHRKQCNRIRKLGEHGGLQARLIINPYKPAVPTVMLPDVVWAVKWIISVLHQCRSLVDIKELSTSN